MVNKNKLILASGSPRRRQLLTNLGVDFEAISPDVDESYEDSMNAYEVPVFIAYKKAEAVMSEYKDCAIIAADTIVVLDDRILEKPKDKKDAFNMLKDLSGKWHKVYSGVCIMHNGKHTQFTEVTRVHFRRLDEDIINWYVNTLEPMDKAGAYGIQGYGAMLVDKIEGDFYNVMGFPISRIMSELTNLNIYDVRKI